MQVVANGAHDYLAGVQPHTSLHLHAVGVAHLLTVAAHGRLHGQSSVAGPHRVVLMGNRRAEQGHNAVAQHLIHRALVAVHRLHHGAQGRVQKLTRLFGVKTLDQLRGPLDVGKQHGDLLAFPFQVATGSEDLLGEMGRRIGLGGARPRFRGAGRSSQRSTTPSAELVPRLIRKSTRRTREG
jgi:hypothetical protein